MKVLIIARNQKEELQICVETIGQYSAVERIAIALIDNNCTVTDETNMQGEISWDYIVYMPPLNPALSIGEIINPVKQYGNLLHKDGKIKILFPVAKLGEEPYYSYEDIFLELSQNDLVLQDASTMHFPCYAEDIIGYALEIVNRRKKRMLVLTSKNHLIDYNIRQVADAYGSLGWDIIMGSLEADSIYKLLQEGIERLFIINNGGWIASLANSDKNIWDELKIPTMNYILDHPMCYDDTLREAPKTGTLLCVDNYHVQYVKRFYPNISKCYFLPLAGDNNLDGFAREWKDREIDVLYVGGYKGDLNLELLSHSEKDILERLLQNMESTTEYIVEKRCREKCENADEEYIKQEILKAKRVDWYIMTYIRVEVIKALIRGGIDVTVYGSGWEKFECFDNPHFIYKGKIPQTECLEQMKNSKIVLNVMPWFKEGTHDRVINAMLAGAVALSDGSAYMDEVFEAGKDYVAYDIKHLEKLPEIIRNILHSDNSEMRERAYKKAKDKHRWIQRIEELEKNIQAEM